MSKGLIVELFFGPKRKKEILRWEKALVPSSEIKWATKLDLMKADE